MKPIANTALVLTSLFLLASCANKSDKTSVAEAKPSPEQLQNLVGASCATCHADNGTSRAPSLIHLGAMSPKSIVASLKTGKMQAQGALLTEAEQIGIAEMLTGRPYVSEKTAIAYCEDTGRPLQNVKYLGWGGNKEGTGFIAPALAKLTKAQLPDLKLKWAFGFDGGTVTRTKPTIIGDYMVFGSQFGEVYCLNKATGCAKWMFEADANIRGGIAVSEDVGNGIQLYFADFSGNTYAVNADDGSLLWRSNLKNDPNNAVTGTPAYFDGLVYVPLTSMEVVTAGQDSFECCRASGQVVAVDAATGKEVWRHRVVAETATEQGVNAAGAKRYGPSGAPVWSSPTVDAKRGLLYIGTGENNSNPPTNTSDALQALDLKTGALKWNYQATSKDAYISACTDGNAANCPEPAGPDVDFGMAPILITRADGREVLVVGQKSGVVHCLDPDTGIPIWQKRIGRGGALGGIHWGMATDGRLAYAANSDWLPFGGDSTVTANPGLFALDLMKGDVVWKSTSDPKNCEGKEGCYNSNSAAPTLIPGVVFAGGLDGHARAYDAENGEVLWDFDTLTTYETVNGVPGQGGSIDGPAPVVADGMVYFNSGYALFGQMPGNVLLAFSAE